MFIKKLFLSVILMIACTGLYIQAGEKQEKKEPTLKDEVAFVSSVASFSASIFYFDKKELIGGIFLSTLGLFLSNIAVKHSKSLYSLYKSDLNKKKKYIENSQSPFSLKNA